MSYINLTNSDDALFHTIQGEGKYVGYPSTFVRLTRCNLRCEWLNGNGTTTRCDTPHTSFDPEISKTNIEEVLKYACGRKSEHVVVTGGEPFFQKSVVELIAGLRKYNKFVTVETNGTLYHENDAQFLSISPKLSTSSMSVTHGKRHEKMRINYDVLCKMVQNHEYQFKFVVNTEDDINEIREIGYQIQVRSGVDISNNLWLMPQGTTIRQFDDKMKWLAEVCKREQWKLSDRMHVRIWGAVKGV